MLASVVICATGPSVELERTLRSLSYVVVTKPTQWEVIVVVYGRAPGRVASTHPEMGQVPLRVIVMPPASSQSAARSLAIKEASGTYLIWLGDNVLVPPDWLDVHAKAFELHQDVAVFAGRVLPLFEPTPPAWLDNCQWLLQFPLGLRDFGEFPLPLSAEEGRVPFAANYAVHRKVLTGLARRLGDISEPRDDFSFASMDVVRDLLREGMPGLWVPDVKVFRMIGVSQQKVEYYYSYYEAFGEAAAECMDGDTSSRFRSVPRWLVRRAAARYGRYHADRLTAPPRQWIRSMIDYAADRGAINHFRHQG